MDKRILICLIAIVVIAVGLVAFFNASPKDTVDVGDLSFKLPEGYHETTRSENGFWTISDGDDAIFLDYYNDSDAYKHVDYEVKKIENAHGTLDVSNFTVNDTTVYNTLYLSSVSQYWFAKDGKVYNIYTWNTNDKLESDMRDLISSVC